MGNGGLTPDHLQAKLFIVPALNKMFDPSAGLPDTRDNFKHLKKFYKKLGEHDPADKGAGRRQRTLRHLAWLLMAEAFDDPATYPYPNNRFRLWLRYLTWVEHITANYKVTVDGQNVPNLRPAAAIKAVLFHSMQTGEKIIFDWDPPPTGSPYELTVDVTHNPTKIYVTSIKEERIPDSIHSDDDDELVKS